MEIAAKEWIIQVLHDPKDYSSQQVLSAVLELRHYELVKEDESLLVPLLDHEDGYVVSQALCSLCRVYQQREKYKDRILQLAKGDPRDAMEMPIQTQAISELMELARTDPGLNHLIQEIAEDRTTPDGPRADAWCCLAKYYDLNFTNRDRNEIFWDPEGAKSKEIYKRVLDGIQHKKGSKEC